MSSHARGRCYRLHMYQAAVLVADHFAILVFSFVPIKSLTMHVSTSGHVIWRNQ